MGLLQGLAPRLAMDGTGGTYFLRCNRRQTVAVFKPADEEPFAPNNPRNYTGKMGQVGFRKGILSGEGYLREVAAYLLDSQTGFSGVPMTTVAEMQDEAFHFQGKGLGKAQQASRTKVGSIQEYISSDDVAGDLAAKMFPVSEVHKIAILDIRMANTDRNEANILVRRGNGIRMKTGQARGSDRLHLIPIDHAYSLPDTLEIAWADWVWLEWPQAKVPFDEKTREFVKNLDIAADIELLRSNLGIREPCLRTMRITGTTLKKGVAAGLTLRQIAGIICRNELDTPSELEIICTQAYKMAKAAKEQYKIKSPNLFHEAIPKIPVTHRTKSAPMVGLSRSISFNDFKPLLVQNNGFKISQIEEKSEEQSQKRLDPSTHTWHLNGKKKDNMRPDGVQRVSQLFFNYLEKLLDQHVALCARQTPDLNGSDSSRCTTPRGSPLSRSGAQPTPTWFSLPDSTRLEKKNVDAEKSLSFKKTPVVLQVRPRSSMISAALRSEHSVKKSESVKVEESSSVLRCSNIHKEENSKMRSNKVSGFQIQKNWEHSIASSNVATSSYGATFSPIAEAPLGKSSDSDWSKSELESEDRSPLATYADGKDFKPMTRLSGLAPPLRKRNLMMSIPNHDFLAKPMRIKDNTEPNLSKSAPRKVPAWKPSWKIRREKQEKLMMQMRNSKGKVTEEIDTQEALPEQNNNNPMEPRRVVGGFYSRKNPPLQSCSQEKYESDLGMIFAAEMEF
eukprot:CAMPEP_0184481144 /NCGR_PEP_ID=MMETSP0113_2-20130426/2675_1 /TAXON_ID=91329 /ORGANISM="Norrisiella sphaerica, Strain BC52" /LENGTH=730 /DNA_ID=CAMNT_0026860075 /DNA_START=447 /DNA_END=2639 /DNA_ORIENTATION=-